MNNPTSFIHEISKKGEPMTVSFKLKGLDEFQKKLEKQAKAVSGQYSFDELFPDSYIQSVSDFDSLASLLKASPENIQSAEDFKAANQEVLDNFIAEKTPFKSWQEMLNDAASKLLSQKLSL